MPALRFPTLMTLHGCNHLFAYGTLLVPVVIERVLGRVPSSEPALLQGYARYRLKNKVYPAIIPEPGAHVAGRIYCELTPAELVALDAYEGDEYQRVVVEVCVQETHARALCYVLGAEQAELLQREPWDLEQFMRDGLQRYL